MDLGLSDVEAARRFDEYGPNRLPEPKLATVFELFARQFLNPFIYILFAAALAALMLRQYPSAVFIVLVLLINAVIGSAQEYFAQKAASALRNLARGTATVVRGGRRSNIDVSEVVPGDLLLISSGDKVAADGHLGSAEHLRIDESLLTGESMPAVKTPFSAKIDEQVGLADRVGEVFAGTIVSQGRGHVHVTRTGLQTELGKIADVLTVRRRSEAPLMVRIRKFTYRVAVAILISIGLLIAVMVLRGDSTFAQILLMSLGLAVSSVPEGLPAALTVTLALGMNRMAGRNVIIRNLLAVEALGSCTFICTDKTGTLTVNELTVETIVLPDGISYEVEGAGLEPGGVIRGGPLEQLGPLLTAAVLANEGSFIEHEGHWVHNGDSVDVALLVLTEKAGRRSEELREHHPAVAIRPYEPENAWAGSLNETQEGTRLFVKGSAERVSTMCSTMGGADGDVPFDADRVNQYALALARRGYRVLAFASGNPDLPSGGQVPDEPTGLTLLGLVGMIDPLRPEAADAIHRCRMAAVDVAMITGDHPETARHIAVSLGLIGAEDEIVNGRDLRAATEAGVDEALIKSSRVFARIEPQQKSQIVETFMAAGHYVSVTGDGVNDAPAMRAANAGIAMGKRGSDVARETADLILTDDNFASIVAGIEEGRVVYNNIRKVIALLITTGASAIILFFLCALTGQPMPLTAVQLLWLNLVANGVQDVALGFEPAEGGELESPPRMPGEPIMERRLIEHVAANGLLMGGLAYAVFVHFLANGVDLESSRNLVLMLMVLFGNIHVLNTRSETRSLFATPLNTNPLLISAVIFAQAIHITAMYIPSVRDVLEIQPIDFHAWLQLLAIASCLIVVDELLKWRHRNSRHLK